MSRSFARHAGFAFSGLAVAVTPLTWSPATQAADIVVSADAQRLLWREYDPLGAAVRKEDGPMLSIGGVYTNTRETDARLLWSVGGRLALARTDVLGSTKANVDMDTHAGYFVFNPEATGGYRFGGRTALDLLAGIGIDFLYKDTEKGWIIGTQTKNRGYSETYVIPYVLLGPGWFQSWSNGQLRFRAGAKLPFLVRDALNLKDGVTLRPEEQVSWNATLEVEIGRGARSHLGIRAFYDSYRLAASDTRTLTSNDLPLYDVVQPDTEIDRAGIGLSWVF